MQTMTIQEKASEAAGWFETAARTDEDSTAPTFDRVKDGAPEWVESLVFEAHLDGDMLPDDWRYKFTREALDYIAEGFETPEDAAHEFADGVSVYTNELLDWLGSHGRRLGYVDEARSEFGEMPTDKGDGISGDIMRGQYAERLEVFESVLRSLEDDS